MKMGGWKERERERERERREGKKEKREKERMNCGIHVCRTHIQPGFKNIWKKICIYF
jgi:hypothetical protein